MPLQGEGGKRQDLTLPSPSFSSFFPGRDEVERDGVFVGTVRSGKLYGAWFQGARLHYYERYLSEFDGIVTSAQLLGEAAK